MARKKRVRKKQSQSPKKSKWDQYLMLDWKEFYLILITWFLFVALHILIGIIIGRKENVLPVIIEWIIPIFLIISILYTMWKRKRK